MVSTLTHFGLYSLRTWRNLARSRMKMAVFVLLFSFGCLVPEQLSLQLLLAAETEPSQLDDTFEIEFWKSVKNSTDPAEFEAYIAAFPNGNFAPLARLRIKQFAQEADPGSQEVEQVEEVPPTREVEQIEETEQADQNQEVEPTPELESSREDKQVPLEGRNQSTKQHRESIQNNAPLKGKERTANDGDDELEEEPVKGDKSVNAAPNDLVDSKGQDKEADPGENINQKKASQVEREGIESPVLEENETEIEEEFAGGGGVVSDQNLAISPADIEFPVPSREEDRRWIGVSIKEVSPKMARDFGLEHPRGAYVTEVVEFAPAAQTDMRAGDLILAIDGVPVRDIRGLVEAILKVNVDATLVVTGLRGQRTFRIIVKVAARVATMVEAARNGNALAALELSRFIRTGQYVSADVELADRVLRGAAYAGNIEANILLAQQIIERSQEDRDEEVRELLLKAIESNHPVWAPKAMYTLGNYLLEAENTEDKAEAVGWFRKAAARTNYDAIYRLAWLNLEGEGGLDKNEDKGIELMHIAADDGDYTGALLNLGIFYTNRSYGRQYNREIVIGAARRVAEQAVTGRVADDWMERIDEILEAWETTAYDPMEIQRHLKELGYYQGAIDGRIGKGTKRAIRRFQAEQNLEETGEPSVALVLDLRWAKIQSG